jgi:6,7-dimethyl-8-ribityllumazine synthase
MSIIEPLVKGAVDALTASGVKADNIVIEDVSGSFELPLACSRLIAASQIQASANADDLMGAASLLDEPAPATPTTTAKKPRKLQGPFSAVIAVGCLIKGSTMHFEVRQYSLASVTEANGARSTYATRSRTA